VGSALQAMDTLLAWVTRCCVGAALVFAPLAFGAVEPWAYSILSALAFTALAAVLIRALSAGGSEALRTPLLIPAALALLLVAAQCLPWPAGLLRLLSPNTLAGHRAAEAALGVAPASWVPASLYPHATRNALVLLAGYVALFVAACDALRTRKQLGRMAALIVATGFAVSLIGILQNLSGTRKLYWWRELSHGGALFGPFVSRNQFAAYAAVCLFVGVGLLLARGARQAGSLRRWREGLGRERSARAHQDFLLGFAVALTAAAVFWSLSRGGILSMLAAFAGVLCALGATGARRKSRLYMTAAAVVAIGWVTYLGWEPVLGRLATLQDVARAPRATWRWTMFADAFRMGRDFPFVGAGAGSFVSVYPVYRTLPTRAISTSPHDEYVHVFAETGIFGVLLLIGAAVLLYRAVVLGLRTRRNPYVRGFLVGALGAPLAITFHSVVDFPMRSPAIAATMAVVAAMLVRAGRIDTNGARTEPRRDANAGPTGAALPDSPRAGGAFKPALVLVAVGIGWLFACDFALEPMRSELDSNFVQRVRRRAASEPRTALALIDGITQGLQARRTGDAGLYAAIADLAMEAAAATEEPEDRLLLTQTSLRLRTRASLAEPMNGQHPFWLALGYLAFQRPDLAWVQAQRTCRLLPNDPWVRAYLADAFRAYGWFDAAAAYLRQATTLAQTRDIAQAMPLIETVRATLTEESAQ